MPSTPSSTRPTGEGLGPAPAFEEQGLVWCEVWWDGVAGGGREGRGSKGARSDEATNFLTIPAPSQKSSWYSWVLNSLVGAVYTFGFILMCPQVSAPGERGRGQRAVQRRPHCSARAQPGGDPPSFRPLLSSSTSITSLRAWHTCPGAR